MKNRKIYFARFTDKRDGEVFYKIGQCYQYDAIERFKVKPEQYENYNIKIMASAWGPADEVDVQEQELLEVKKKDFWIEGKFSGITEVRKFNRNEIGYIIKRLQQLNSDWYVKRHSKQTSNSS